MRVRQQTNGLRVIDDKGRFARATTEERETLIAIFEEAADTSRLRSAGAVVEVAALVVAALAPVPQVAVPAVLALAPVPAVAVEVGASVGSVTWGSAPRSA